MNELDYEEAEAASWKQPEDDYNRMSTPRLSGLSMLLSNINDGELTVECSKHAFRSFVTDVVLPSVNETIKFSDKNGRDYDHMTIRNLLVGMAMLVSDICGHGHPLAEQASKLVKAHDYKSGKLTDLVIKALLLY